MKVSVLKVSPEEYFFSVYLGREVGVCGDFIYKGFEALENNNPLISKGEEEKLTFLNESSAFSFLLNTGVAFERLGKIILLFLLRKTKSDKENSFFKSQKKNGKSILTLGTLVFTEKEKEKEILQSHSNTAIIDYIHTLDSEKLELSTDERHLLQSFDEFYKKSRYGRFHPIDVDGYNQDTADVNKLLNNWLEKDIKVKSYCDSKKEKALYKLGVSLNTLSHKYYNVIKKLATEMNVYTYELHGNSYAELVFLETKNSLHDIFIQQRIARKELFYFLAYDQIKTKINKIGSQYEIPLPLDDILDDVEDFLKFGNTILLVDSVYEALDSWAEIYENSEKQQKIENREHEIQELITMIRKDHRND